ncbi:MAG: cation transporter [Syntrophaceae bacterium]|jgi:cobalt-zinc-cadmium efflux system protein|nr:cation transporter [Syntrophaceae bacterium]
MDAVPEDIDFISVKNDLLAIPAVTEVNDLQIWQTGANQKLLSAHLKSGEASSNHEEMIHTIQEMLAHKYGIAHTTLQTLPSSAGEMGHCN